MVIELKKLGYAVVIIFLLFLTGCYSSNQRNVTVEISSRFWDDRVYTDIAGISDDEYSQYDMCSKEEYWKMNSDLRIDLHSESFIFGVAFPTKQKISVDDSIWNFWRNDDYLIVLVKYPKSYTDIPWKIIIPFDSKTWDDEDIFIYISDKGVKHFNKELEYTNPSYIAEEDMRRYIN